MIQEGEFPVSVHLPKLLAALSSRKKIEFNFRQNVRQNLARLAQVPLCEQGCVGRFLRSNVNGSGTTTYMGDKASGWLDHTRLARRNEDRAFVQSGEDAIQVERHFAEPADVRSNATSAVAPGNLGGWFVDIGVAERGSAACVTAAFEEFAVHVDTALRPCLLVKVIHILRAEAGQGWPPEPDQEFCVITQNARSGDSE
jgi:hypothetical protein